MPLTRFAPAPTGALHLGHVVNAIYVWGLGRTLGADILLRIEDHDRQRSRATYEAGILDDLDWLGFEPDLFPTSTFRTGPSVSRQSNRHDTYATHLESLRAAGLVYGCRCSRQDLARMSDESGELRYPGTCRDRAIPLTDDVSWRLRLDGSDQAPIDDVILGPGGLAGTAPGDPALRDRNRNWTYQFAVTVDDLEQGVDLVIRGQDLASSTALQVQLAALLGRPLPARFAHHPLVMRTATRKLSKSDGDTGISALRQAGWMPERVIGEAAHRVGLLEVAQPIRAAEVSTLFPR